MNIYKKSMALLFLCGIASTTYGVDSTYPQELDSPSNRVKTSGQSIKEVLSEIKKKASNIIIGNDYSLTDKYINEYYGVPLKIIEQIETLNIEITSVLADICKEMAALYSEKKFSAGISTKASNFSNIIGTLSAFQMRYCQAVIHTLHQMDTLIKKEKGNNNIIECLNKSKDESMISMFIHELKKNMSKHCEKIRGFTQKLNDMDRDDDDSSEELQREILTRSIDKENAIARKRLDAIVKTLQLFEKEKSEIKDVLARVSKIDTYEIN